jgi:hypothetical protein
LISLDLSSLNKFAVILALAGLGVCRWPAAAQQVSHLAITQPGGFPGLPVMNGIVQVTNGVNVMWDGPSGYYQLLTKASLKDSTWLAVGGRSLNWQTTVAITPSNAFFRVSGPSPHYLGSQGCTECHAAIQTTVLKTAHAGAFTDASFVTAGGQSNPSCLACHTVGYKLPTGFTSKSATPLLANVQCENCHGPAANHAANPDDSTVIPQVEIAATVCGGCHSASQTAYTNPPTFEEWSASGHATVVPDALRTMSSSTANIRSCGVCHSGSARLAMIGGQDPAVTLANDYNVPITCAVCHDPHQSSAYPSQLRNPISSTNNFELTSTNVATVTAFTGKYNANININLCAQCHNDRGAAWTDTSRAPHHSVQYNFLLGSIGQLLNGPATFNPGTHAGLPASADYSISGAFYLTNQCADCHMQTDGSGGRDHSTMVTSDTVCLNCHITSPEVLRDYYLTPAISNSVTTLITALNRWSARQTNALLTATNVVAWEYTTPGGLTWQTNSAGAVISWSLTNPVTFTGPNAAGQNLLTTNFPNILKVRFNLYTVLNDGSLGVHNPSLAINLLNAAQIWMVQLLQ